MTESPAEDNTLADDPLPGGRRGPAFEALLAVAQLPRDLAPDVWLAAVVEQARAALTELDGLDADSAAVTLRFRERAFRSGPELAGAETWLSIPICPEDREIGRIEALAERPPTAAETDSEALQTVAAIARLLEDRLARDRLAGSLELARDAIHSSPDAILWTRLDGRLAELNVAGRALFGLNADETPGGHLGDWIPRLRAEGWDTFREQCVAEGTAAIEGEFCRTGRPSRPIELVASLQIVDPQRLICIVLRDVTERKRRELERERQIDQILEAATDFIASTDERGRCLYLNRAARRILGVGTERSITGLELAGLFCAEDAQMLRSVGFPTARTAGTFAMEARVDSAAPPGAAEDDDIGVRLSLNLVRHLAQDETITGYSCIARDVTADVRSQRELRRSEQAFRSLVSNIPGIVYRCALDTDWTMFFISDQVEPMTGYTASEVTRSRVISFAELIHEDDRARVEEVVQKAVDHRLPYALEYRLTHRDGSVRPVFETGRAVFHRDGQPEFLIGTVFDRTDRHRLKEGLAERERYLSTVFISAGVGIVELDSDGVVTNCNDLFASLFPCDCGSVGGSSFADMILAPERDDVKEELDALIHGWKKEAQLVVRVGEESSPLWMDLRMAAVRETDGQLRSIVAFANDITALKHNEVELERARRTAEAANQAKSTFLATMGHELRTPLNAVINMAGLALETELTHKQEQFLGVIQSSGRGLLALINDILDFSRIEADRLELDEQPFDLRRLVEDLTDSFRPHVQGNRLELIVCLDAGAPERVVGDALRLRQVLMNLLSNAFKFTQSGDIQLSIRLQDEADRERRRSSGTGEDELCRLRFAVKDTGIGIAPEERRRLFRPFTQLEATATRRFAGTGMGLTIAQRLVKLLGGELELESTKGVGSEFSFVLPLKVAAWRTSSQIAGRPPGLRQVVVVEDNAASRALLGQMLDELGVPARLYESAEAAEEGESERADGEVWIIDWHLPGRSGLDLALELQRRTNRKHKVILMSAFASVTEEDAAREKGIATFLHKPLTRSSLVAALGESTGSRTGRARRPRVSDQEQAIFRGRRVLLAVADAELRESISEQLRRLGPGLEAVDSARDLVRVGAEGGFDAALVDEALGDRGGLEPVREMKRILGRRTPPAILLTRAFGERKPDPIWRALVPVPVDADQLRLALEEVLSPGSESTVVDVEEVQAAKDRLQLSTGSFRSLLGHFWTAQRGTARALRDALSQDNRSSLQHLAHSLEGDAGNFGLEGIRSCAKDLGELLRGDLPHEARTLELIDRLEASMKIHYQGSPVEVPIPSAGPMPVGAPSAEAVPSAVLASLRGLGEALEDFDIDLINQRLREVSVDDLDQESASELKRVQRLVDEFEYEGATELLARILLRLEQG